MSPTNMGSTNEGKIDAPSETEGKAEILQQEIINSTYDQIDEVEKPALDESTSAEEAAKVLRKIDWHLVPVLVLVNAIQLIDKNVSSSN